MAPLPIEEAWRTMVAGMHIHEHFLEVERLTQQRRGQVLYDRYRTLVNPHAPPLESLRERFPDAFLEHCYRQPDPASFRQLPASLRFSHLVASVASTALLIVEESDCFVEDSGCYVVDTRRLPRSARRLDPVLERDVTALVEAAALGHLVQLNVRVLIQRAGSAPADPTPDHRRFLCGTAEVYTEDGPLACAEHLLATAAAQWLYCFVLARPQPDAVTPRTWPSPWTREPADAIAMAMQILAHCIRLEFLERSLAQEEATISRTCRRAGAERVEQERLRLQEVERFVYDLDAAFSPPDGSETVPYNNLGLYGLLNSHYPGPRQFEKYVQGSGVGVYERG